MALNITSRFIIAAGVTGEQSVRGLTGSVNTLQGAASQLRGALGALGVGVSVAGFAAMIKGSIDAADRLKDLSQSTGLAVETLSGLDLVAKQSGTSLDTVAKGVAIFSKNLVNAPETLKQFGVSLAGIRDGSIDSREALARFADQISRMPDGAEKTALAMKVMGKSAADLIPFLNEGGDAIRNAAGIMTGAFADAADKFNDQIAEMSANTQKIAADLAGAMVDGLTDVIEAFNELERDGAGIISFFGEGLANGVKLATGLILGLGLAVEGLAFGLSAMKAKLTFDTDGLEKLRAEFAKTEAEYGRAFGKLSGRGNYDQRQADAYSKLRGMNSPTGPTDTEIKAAEKLQSVQAKGLAARNNMVEKEHKIRRDEFKLNEDRNKSLEEFIAGLESEAVLSGVAIEDRQLLVDIEKAREIAGLKAGEALAKGEEARIRASAKLKSVNDSATKKAEESARQWTRIWDHASEGIQDSLAGAFRGVISGATDNFKDFAASLKNLFFDVASQIAAALVFNPVIGGITGALGIGSQAAGGAAGNAAGGGLSSLFGNFASSAAGKMITAPFGGLSSILFGKGAVGALGPQIPTSGLLGSGGTLLGSSGLATALPYVGAALGALSLFSAFGKDKKIPNAGGNVKFANDSFAVGDTYTLDGAPIQPVIDALNQSVTLLNRLTALPQYSVDPNAHTAGFPGFASGFNSKGTGVALTPEGMLRDIISGGKITGLSEVEKTLLLGSDNIAAAIEKLISGIESGTDAGGLKATIENAILQFTDPKGFAVKMLAAEQQAFRAQLSAAGVLGELQSQLSQLEGLQLADVLKRFTDNVSGANDNFASASQRISGFLSDLTASSGSVLPLGQALSNARGEFASLVSDARGGGAGRIAELTPDILSAAQRFNELNRSANASSGEYFNGFNAMTETLRSLQLTLGGGSNTTQRDIFIQGAEQTTELRAIRNELLALRAENTEMRNELRRVADRAA